MPPRPVLPNRPILPQRENGWHPEDIRAAIRKRCGSMTALSLHLGMNPKAVSMTIRRPNAHSGIEIQIAALLGVPAHELWPDRWRPDGERLPRTGAEHPGLPPSRHRQKREAA